VHAQLKEIEEEKARIHTIVEERNDKIAELTKELHETKVVIMINMLMPAPMIVLHI
jgi:uncharacterized protein YaaR (DUF327 family)